MKSYTEKNQSTVLVPLAQLLGNRLVFCALSGDFGETGSAFLSMLMMELLELRS